MSTEQRDRPLRVLVANGYRDAADVPALLLECWGYETGVAYTGPAALAEARAYHPDVVVAELCLPELDGFRLADNPRGWQRTPWNWRKS
jgi:CheY-like chemotaxis protein